MAGWPGAESRVHACVRSLERQPCLRQAWHLLRSWCTSCCGADMVACPGWGRTRSAAGGGSEAAAGGSNKMNGSRPQAAGTPPRLEPASLRAAGIRQQHQAGCSRPPLCSKQSLHFSALATSAPPPAHASLPSSPACAQNKRKRQCKKLQQRSKGIRSSTVQACLARSVHRVQPLLWTNVRRGEACQRRKTRCH